MPRIIIAEDSNPLRESYAMAMPRFIDKLFLEIVPKGEELVGKIRNEKYDLAITDHDMGRGITGIDAISKIRQFNKTIPLFLCTSTKNIERTALEVGATGVIDKEGVIEEGMKYIIERINPYLNLK